MNYDLIPQYMKDYLEKYFFEYEGEFLCEKVSKPIPELGDKSLLDILEDEGEDKVVDYLNRQTARTGEPLLRMP